MNILADSQFNGISRRDFLRLSSAGLLGLFSLPYLHWKPGRSLQAPELPYGRVIDDDVPFYDRPSLDGNLINYYWQDLVKPITGVTLGADKPSYNRVWYEINGEGFVHSGSVQPVDVRLNPVVMEIPPNGILGEVTVPFTDAVWSPLRPTAVAYRYIFGTTYWVTGVVHDESGQVWYRTPDDQKGFLYYVKAEHLHIYTPEEVTQISPEVPGSRKRLEVRLAEQVVIAYEGERAVFMSKCATGASFSTGDFSTPPGYYRVRHKRPSRHMAGGNLASPAGYDLPGVPWVCTFTESGISFHGTFWHNDFGKPRSHGCVNLTPQAARWVYRWCNPFVPLELETLFDETGTRGTGIDIL